LTGEGFGIRSIDKLINLFIQKSVFDHPALLKINGSKHLPVSCEVTVITDPNTKINQEEVAYRALIRMIVMNHFRPGDSLLETILAEKLGLSRTPVSHALDRLLAEGFLEKRSKRGYFIPLPDPVDAEHVFSVRQLLEGKAAAEAAAAFRPEDMDRLETLMRESENSVKRQDKELFSITNEKFHLGIAELSGNPYLERYVRQVFWRSNLYIFFFDGFYRNRGDSIPFQKTPEQHQRVLDAIRAKDGALARRLMQEHILYTYESMVSVLNVFP
jgi:DNA-binding GntR family transcriptional regulator